MKSDGCASCSAYRCWFVDMLEKMVKMMKPNCGQGGIKALVKEDCTADRQHGRAHFWITDLQQEAENGEEHEQPVRLAAGAGEGGVKAPALVIVAAPAHAAQRALISLCALRALVGAAGTAT